jgi:hypothetical protein
MTLSASGPRKIGSSSGSRFARKATFASVLRLGLDHEDLNDVTTTANALIAAFQASAPEASQAVLIHGSPTTVVVIISWPGRGFRHQLPDGWRFHYPLASAGRNCTEEAAEA